MFYFGFKIQKLNLSIFSVFSKVRTVNWNPFPCNFYFNWWFVCFVIIFFLFSLTADEEERFFFFSSTLCLIAITVISNKVRLKFASLKPGDFKVFVNLEFRFWVGLYQCYSHNAFYFFRFLMYLDWWLFVATVFATAFISWK